MRKVKWTVKVIVWGLWPCDLRVSYVPAPGAGRALALAGQSSLSRYVVVKCLVWYGLAKLWLFKKPLCMALALAGQSGLLAEPSHSFNCPVSQQVQQQLWLMCSYSTV